MCYYILALFMDRWALNLVRLFLRLEAVSLMGMEEVEETIRRCETGKGQKGQKGWFLMYECMYVCMNV